MLAGYYERRGAADEVIQVGQVDAPTAGQGEVRVKLHASGVNPSDVKKREGRFSKEMDFPRVVPHSDGAGVIDQVGAGVSETRLGERVWVYNGGWRRPLGTAAELIALPASQAVRLPDNTSFTEGACLGIPAMTAHRCVFSGGPVKGQTVLVTGGAGAVGFYAVGLAAWGGAAVIATVSSADKAAAARSAGAHHVIDYRSEDVAARVKELTGGAGVDRIVDVDFGANLTTSLSVLKDHGAITIYAAKDVPAPAVPTLRLMMKNATLQYVLVYSLTAVQKAEACADITEWLEGGKARHLVAARFPLGELAAAHQLQESGKALGNIVVELGG